MSNDILNAVQEYMINGHVSDAPFIINDYVITLERLDNGVRISATRGGQTESVVVYDGDLTNLNHEVLANRNADDQHPINAISGLRSELDSKQGVISDLEQIRTNAGKGATAVQHNELSSVAMTGAYNDLNGKPNLARVATSGSYNDLVDKPSMVLDHNNLTGRSGYNQHPMSSITGLIDNLNGKQGVIADLSEIRANARKADTAVQPSDLARVATTGSYNDLTDIPNAITDVQVNGTSVVTDGVANVPIAAANTHGVLKAGNPNYGTLINDAGDLFIMPSTNAVIKNRVAGDGYSTDANNRCPIVPSHLDYAVKAAMTDGRGAAWTPAEQASARERMGAASQLDVDKLKAAAEGHLYMFQQDSTEAYEKSVPSDAMQWATLDKVGGKMLVWNQEMPDYLDKEAWSYPATRYDIVDSAVAFQPMPDNDFSAISTNKKSGYIGGHALYVSYCVKSDAWAQTGYVGFATLHGYWTLSTLPPIDKTRSDWQRISGIIKFNDGTPNSNVFTFRKYKEDTNASVYLKDIFVCNLTAMFGAGNEPTAEQFEAMFPADYYPYSEPTLMTYSPESVVNSTGDTKDLSALVGKYFPDGMKSAGTVYDEIDLERGVAVQRVKTATSDMITSRWSNTGVEATNSKAYQILFDALNQFTESGYYAGICDRFDNIGTAIYSNDKIGMAIYGSTAGTYLRLRVNKTDVPDATAMDAYITANPFEFVYELVEPIETPIDPADLEGLAFLNVEAGGSLTFTNDQGADYHVPLPNSETWMIKLPGVTA